MMSAYPLMLTNSAKHSQILLSIYQKQLLLSTTSSKGLD